MLRSDLRLAVSISLSVNPWKSSSKSELTGLLFLVPGSFLRRRFLTASTFLDLLGLWLPVSQLLSDDSLLGCKKINVLNFLSDKIGRDITELITIRYT